MRVEKIFPRQVAGRRHNGQAARSNMINNSSADFNALQPTPYAHGSPLSRALAAASSALHHQSVPHPAAGSVQLAPPEAPPKSHHSAAPDRPAHAHAPPVPLASHPTFAGNSRSAPQTSRTDPDPSTASGRDGPRPLAAKRAAPPPPHLSCGPVPTTPAFELSMAASAPAAPASRRSSKRPNR